MYNPKGNGELKKAKQVQFIEMKPPKFLMGIVHRFSEIKTNVPLDEEYLHHALPDACTYLIFDQLDVKIAGVTNLYTISEELNLGKEFHYVWVRFLPGVWKGQVKYGLVNLPYTGILPLKETNYQLACLDFTAKQAVLIRLIEQLIKEKIVVANPIAEKLASHIDIIHTVEDMADIVGVSSRQLQRILKNSVGFKPHDFLKILHLQQSIGDDGYSLYYTDQSHFIRSFRKATGYSPMRYTKKFDV
ncbi:helix-turn-helix domain-containing protein [Tetragenococcus koreensis]|uniref:helix-turn-helix domain-containing protein n=1 Tax=Tetragenococcus koreensis TaxID=290335 RepID=UPI000F4D5E40|nr:AraC family transcriptional regulator [Tetragenococcus koreensis]AYW45536.1 AraC family transcriptional regulator [Tetragenococcus koreensis]MCF1618195.1 AraC family transcriptional regulator [Tetragenococcus koreensis]MCF1623044.1 AraC family transcriptional regulator [Tetragenococcus koreensis]MCF1679021.1 AraC family transcriptional regulator [Tetragenococcus koreensis]MCF1681447.1 AraC family transcriptional regulator [Tetragenococcus koreensis]